jgi:tRNA pseudouridine55 synthase
MSRKKGRDIHGWLVLDKDIGQTSTQAVGAVKRLYEAKKAGHAGTLDPLATGILPIALGEATKTVPYVVGGEKAYRFTVRWGEERDTDDADGAVTTTSQERPTKTAIEEVAKRFVGEILQTPPRYSAIKIQGERAYDLARGGEVVELEARPVVIERLQMIDMPDAATSVFEAECGKGTYVRSLARDMGRLLGCLGHVSQLRRTRVGPFAEADAILLARLEEIAAGPDGATALKAVLRPVAAALHGLPQLVVSPSDAARLRRGQGVLIRGRDAPILTGEVFAISKGELVAVGQVTEGELKPTRVFNLAGH